MKLIGRTLAILAAALVVVGVTFALGSSGLAGTAGGPPDRAAAMSQTAGGPAAGRPRRDHAESSGFSVFGIGEVLKNLVLVGVIVAIVRFGMRLFSRRGSGAKSRRTPSAPAPSV